MLGAGFGEFGLLGQEPISGVNSIGSGSESGGHKSSHLEIALGRVRGADAYCPVGHFGGQTLPVHLRYGGHGFDIQLAAGPDDAEGDFPPVGDQYPRNGIHEKLAFLSAGFLVPQIITEPSNFLSADYADFADYTGI